MGANAPKQALSWEDARQRVVSEVKAGRQKPQTESVRLEEAFGRVTAEDIRADRDYPALARALRDGFAVRSSDVPGTLPLAGESRAGAPLPPPLLPGQTLEIMTGAPIPEGADAVVMVEHVTRNGNSVTLPAAAAGQFINPQGAEARRNDVLVPAEIRLDASHISVLAMVGKTYVVVYRRPVVAILSTGDELVAVDATPAPFEIRNSNSYSLAALVADAGGIPQVLPPAPDTEEGLLALLRKGLAADLLLISGGVSAGKYDLVKPCLAQEAQFVNAEACGKVRRRLYAPAER